MGRHVLPVSRGLSVAALVISRPLAPTGPPAARERSWVKTIGPQLARRNRGGRRGPQLDPAAGRVQFGI
jgi:hypothetical protein